MLAERETWQAAKLLVDRYGEGAPVQAAQRADELRGEGDTAGEAVWFRIENACRELLRVEPGPGERVS
jgi:hypothetical protein